MKNFLTLIFLFALTTAFVPVGVQAETAVPDASKAIRTTPPAPRFSEAERQAELARRRARVLDAMQDKSILILFSAEPRIYTNDVDFMYRQENNLYYLTALKQPGAMLVLVKDGASRQEFLFLPNRNPQREIWEGRMYSNEDAARLSGLKTIIPAAEVRAFLDSIKSNKAFTASGGAKIPGGLTNLYLLLPDNERDGNGKREFAREDEFSKSVSGPKVLNAQPIFAELRLIKSPYEIKLLQHAIDITTEAQMRAMATVGRAKWEYEVQAEVEYIFRKRNADYWGYPSIVGCGPNATTLHYVESQGEVKPGDLLLMDVGAEYDHYTADVTRTFPVNGKFSKEQAEIYQIVFDAQEAAAKATKPGVPFNQVSRAADEVIKQGLTRLGLITGPNATVEAKFQDRTYPMPQYRLWYMHGLGHWLGMNVHDVGDYSTPLRPGMVFTNEPGIYVRADALDYLPDTPANREFLAKIRPVFEKYKNIGVRIEDDILVTETGVEWMTKALPRTISDIESFMARAPKEVQVARKNTFVNPSLAVLGFDAGFESGAGSSVGLFGMQHLPLSGQSPRRGWVSSGKHTASTNLHHSH